MNKKGSAAIIIFFIILIVIFIVWGLIGASEANSPGVTCDMGIGDALCWKWHKNIVGQVGEAFNDFFGGGE